jgi:chemosensory pili system protein ChpA (sensor histidine kinase/response regulator)
VDDEAVVRRVLANTLTRAGFEVEQAANGAQAWEWLQQQRPDAVITDIDMPRMTGAQLCQLIEEEQSDRRYPIFVVTSKTAVEHRSWSREMENVWFIEKPFSMRKLVDQLKDTLAREPVVPGEAQ